MNLNQDRTVSLIIGLIWAGLSQHAVAQASLENPQPSSYQSGIGVLSGWSCSSPVSIVIDGALYSPAYGTARADAASVCGGNPNVGFGLLFNFNILGAGIHTAQLRVNGAPVGSPVSFTVTVPVSEFAVGLTKTVSVPDFPIFGKTTQLVWQQSQQNFAIASVSGASGSTCTRGIFSPPNGGNYSINTYTQNSVQVGGIAVAKIGGGNTFVAVWSSGALDQNPFLAGRSTSGLGAGIYGVMGDVNSSAYPGFKTGDVIQLTGSPASVLIITDVSTGAQAFFYPSTAAASPLPCPSGSGAYISGHRNGLYTVTVFGLGSGVITAALTGGGNTFSANWTAWTGSIAAVNSSAYPGFAVGGKISLVDIGENALAIYPIDTATSRVGTVAIFLEGF